MWEDLVAGLEVTTAAVVSLRHGGWKILIVVTWKNRRSQGSETASRDLAFGKVCTLWTGRLHVQRCPNQPSIQQWPPGPFSTPHTHNVQFYLKSLFSISRKCRQRILPTSYLSFPRDKHWPKAFTTHTKHVIRPCEVDTSLSPHHR